jgi:stress-induced morphogen
MIGSKAGLGHRIVDLFGPRNIDSIRDLELKSGTVLAEEIKRRIETGLPGAQAEVRDYTGGGDHFEALVVSESFEGKSLVQRHQAVYGALGEAMRAEIHALTLTTLTPNQYRERR